tara:strand:- start:646 stop:1359 length:714 start_codon:yes stop_codon:yes gene_type:complete
MKLNNKLFKKQGYIHIENVIPIDMLKLSRRESINLKRNKISEIGNEREWGSGIYWGGIEMASKLSEDLMMCYIHPFMQQIVPVFLETQDIWLFDDQVVVKLPNEDFTSPEHCDNQYGPDPEGALNGDFQTINFMWILTNCNKESGALEIKNNKTGKWDLIEAKAGDMIAVDGNTLHRSSKNTTDKPCAIFACIFSSKQLIVKGFHEMKWRFCNCRDGLSNHKLHKEDQKLWEKHSKK